MDLLSAAKVFPESTLLQDRADELVLRKIFLTPFGQSVFSAKILLRADSEPSELPKQIPSVPAPLRHIKKSKVMRSTEKNKRKQKSSTLPLGIGPSRTTWLLLGAVVRACRLCFSGWKMPRTNFSFPSFNRFYSYT